MQKIDRITLEKLVIAKQIYQQSLIQSYSKHNLIGRMMSVVGFDLAVETVLKVIIGFFVPQQALKLLSESNFAKLIDITTDEMTKRNCGAFPDRLKIEKMRKIRNAAQHDARYPNESEVSDCRTYSKDFLEAIVYEVWGVEFEAISLIDLIQNKQIKEILFDAEKKLKEGNFKEAILQSAIALNWTFKLVRNPITGSELENAGITQGNIYDIIEALQETILCNTFGINYADFTRFKKIAGSISITKTGKIEIYERSIENPSKDEAEFVVNFCIDAVTQIESIGGIPEIEAPVSRSGNGQTHMGRAKLRDDEKLKVQEREFLRRNRQILLAKFIEYHKEIADFCKVEFMDGGVGFAKLDPRLFSTLKQGQMLIYCSLGDLRPGYLVAIA